MHLHWDLSQNGEILREKYMEKYIEENTSSNKHSVTQNDFELKLLLPLKFQAAFIFCFGNL